MQKEILGSSSLKITGGVLITRAERFKHKRAQTIFQAAKNQAKKLIKEARGEVEALRQNGYRQGYEEGVLSAAQAVVGYMQNYQAMTLALHLQLYDKARLALSTALGDDAVFTSLLQSWLPDSGNDDNSHFPLELLVPSAMGARVGQLKKEVQRWYKGTVLVTCHSDNRYVMKYPGQLAEFVPEEHVEQLLVPLIDLKVLRQECSALSQDGLEKLKSQLLKKFEIND